jgi:hypothetical protein
MDAEQTIAEIETLERMFVVPDTRPLSANDLALRIGGTTKCSGTARGFGCGSISEFAAEVNQKADLGFRG